MMELPPTRQRSRVADLSLKGGGAVKTFPSPSKGEGLVPDLAFGMFIGAKGGGDTARIGGRD